MSHFGCDHMGHLHQPQSGLWLLQEGPPIGPHLAGDSGLLQWSKSKKVQIKKGLVKIWTFLMEWFKPIWIARAIRPEVLIHSTPRLGPCGGGEQLEHLVALPPPPPPPSQAALSCNRQSALPAAVWSWPLCTFFRVERWHINSLKNYICVMLKLCHS